MNIKYLGLIFVLHFSFSNRNRQSNDLENQLKEVEKKLINFIRGIYKKRKLGNYEFRTAAMVAKHFKFIGIEVRIKTGVAGAVDILKGVKQRFLLALCADMGILPALVRTAVPFASKVTKIYEGKETDVMQTSGHHAHATILTSVA